MSERSLHDRVFVLAWRGVDVARMRSTGSGEMFWESFRVEPLRGDALPAVVLDAGAWSRDELTMRHERTGIVMPYVLTAGGRAPSLVPNLARRLARHGSCAVVEIRGTYSFVAPERRPLAGRLRDWLARPFSRR
jgi:hypothetical protein